MTQIAKVDFKIKLGKPRKLSMKGVKFAKIESVDKAVQSIVEEEDRRIVELLTKPINRILMKHGKGKTKLVGE